MEGPTPSKDKGSVNYVVVLSLIDNKPDLMGKEVIERFNSKAISMALPLIAASQGKAVGDFDKKDFAVDLDTLVGCKVDGKVVLDTYEGQIKNEFESFLPYKKAAGAALPGPRMSHSRRRARFHGQCLQA